MSSPPGDEASSTAPMITVKVRHFAAVREITKVKNETILLVGGSSPYDLLEALAKKYGRGLREMILDKDDLRLGIAILVNGLSLQQSELRSRTLGEGDEVVVVPPVGGGIGEEPANSQICLREKCLCI